MVVSPAEFKRSLSEAAPAPGLSAPLAALCWAANGDWEKAHVIAQGEATVPAAWVHAYLHRVEGDLGNAGYWYRQAGQPVPAESHHDEWERIVAALLANDKP